MTSVVGGWKKCVIGKDLSEIVSLKKGVKNLVSQRSENKVLDLVFKAFKDQRGNQRGK